MLNLQHESARSLRNALRANGIFSGISGLMIVILHSQVLNWLGIGGVNIIVVGVGLILFSAYLFWMSSRREVDKSLVSGVIGGDWAWVLASAVLIVLKGSMFSTLARCDLTRALFPLGFNAQPRFRIRRPALEKPVRQQRVTCRQRAVPRR